MQIYTNRFIYGYHRAMLRTGAAIAVVMMPAITQSTLYRIAGITTNMYRFIVSGIMAMAITTEVTAAIETVAMSEMTEVIAMIEAMVAIKATVTGGTNYSIT